MSDWAARLSQKPATVSPARPGNGPVNSSPVNANPTTSSASKPRQTVKPVKADSPPQQQDPISQEYFNATEILKWANARFSADLEEARGDKVGDKTAVYRSLESSSSWKTKGPGNGRKNGKEDDRFDLLQELNRSFQGRQKR